MKGFSLLETLVAIAVVAVLVTIAIPAWSHVRAAAGSAAARSELAASLLGAVAHSALLRVEVVVCPNAGLDTCTGQADWDPGWLSFADLDGDRVRDPGELILSTHERLPDDVHLRSTGGRTRLVFQPGGSNAGSNVTFTLCDARGPEHATALVLSNEGKLHLATPSRRAAHGCVQGG